MITQARNLTIIKKPRSGPIPDNPVDFPPLDNLHLELLEVKRKIKPGLPLVPVKKRNPPRPISQPSKPKEDKPTPSKEEKPRKPKDDELEIPQKSKEKKIVHDDEDKDLLNELADSDREEITGDRGESSSSSSEKLASSREEDEDEIEEAQQEEEEDDPYAGLSPEEREAKEKEEYIWRFRILKKQYKTPQVPIPEYNEHSDLPEMKRTYDRTIYTKY